MVLGWAKGLEDNILKKTKSTSDLDFSYNITSHSSFSFSSFLVLWTMSLVICDKLPNRFAPKGESKKWPSVDGYENINVCSAQPKTRIYRQLSPFVLGPVMTPNGDISTCLENLWQGSKVFPGDDINENGVARPFPNSDWFKRRQEIFSSTKAYRHIPGKKGIKPLYHWWGGKPLDYITARKEIYIPLYIELAKKTIAYQRLEEKVGKGEKIQILGFDGRKFIDLKKEIENLLQPFGHELVLCMMLLNQI